MKTAQKWISFMLCLVMLLSASALAENTVDTAVATTAVELAETDVVATLNGEPITWGDVLPLYNSLANQYGSGYDMTDAATIEMFRSIALRNAISEAMLSYQAKALGLDQLTEEEIAASDASADADWASAIENYVSYFHSDLTADSSEEDKQAANDEAVKYYNDEGWTPETLRANYIKYAIYDKVEGVMTQDAVVTDEDVEKAYQDLVAADKALYENDINAYIEYNSYVDSMAYYAMMYGSSSDMDYAWYKPAGFRAVKHILLKVDDELMNAYNDLTARYEEQMNAEEAAAETTTDESAEPTAEPTATPEPVTEEQVNLAKAAILESLAATIDEINQKVADGVDFDELIATYGVDADGNPTDKGMLNEPYKTSGYEVAQGSTNYVAPFVAGAFSVDNIGDVAAPVISTHGVHIIKYIGDVPAGPIAMTDEQRLAKRETLLTTKKNELYSTKMEQWLNEATIEYTGTIPSMDELLAQQAATEETEAVTEAEGEAAVEQDAAPVE